MLTKRSLTWVWGGILVCQAMGFAQDYTGRYVSASNALGQKVVETGNGDYLVLGSSEEELFLVKYNTQLKRVWAKTHRFVEARVRKAMVTSLQDECVIIVDAGGQIMQIVHDLDDGREIRKDEVDLGGRVSIQDLVPYGRDHVLLGGNILASDGVRQGSDMILLVINLSGEIQHTSPYDVPDRREMLTQIYPTRGGDYVLIGNSIQNGFADILVRKIEGQDLTSSWVRIFEARVPISQVTTGRFNVGQWITQAPEGGYYMAGTAATFDNQFQALCMRLDENGEMMWRTPFNGREKSDLIGCFVEVNTRDQILFVAEKRLPGLEGTRLCFAKLTSEGEQLDMVEQVKAGQVCNWADGAWNLDQGFVYLKNCLFTQQERLVVETEKILDLESFFTDEKARSERVLRSLQWRKNRANGIQPTGR